MSELNGAMTGHDSTPPHDGDREAHKRQKGTDLRGAALARTMKVQGIVLGYAFFHPVTEMLKVEDMGSERR